MLPMLYGQHEPARQQLAAGTARQRGSYWDQTPCVWKYEMIVQNAFFLAMVVDNRIQLWYN